MAAFSCNFLEGGTEWTNWCQSTTLFHEMKLKTLGGNFDDILTKCHYHFGEEFPLPSVVPIVL